MACSTHEHVIHLEDSVHYNLVDSCRLGDDIYVMRQSNSGEFFMQKFSADFERWEDVIFKNSPLCRPLTETDVKFRITSSDDKIYMWVHEYNFSVFDPKTNEWKILEVFNRDRYFHQILVAETEIYLLESTMMTVIDMESMRIKREVEFVWRFKNFVVVNGEMYIVDITLDGLRQVRCFDKNTNELIDIVGSNESRVDTRLSLITYEWACDNKIYSAIEVKKSKALIIACFDLGIKKWTKLYEIPWDYEMINNIIGIGTVVYITYKIKGNIVLRKFDLEPNLETRSLVQVVRNCLDSMSKNNFLIMYKKLPLSLRPRFVDMIIIKSKKWSKDEKEDDNWSMDVSKGANKYWNMLLETEKFNVEFREDDSMTKVINWVIGPDQEIEEELEQPYNLRPRNPRGRILQGSEFCPQKKFKSG